MQPFASAYFQFKFGDLNVLLDCLVKMHGPDSDLEGTGA